MSGAYTYRAARFWMVGLLSALQTVLGCSGAEVNKTNAGSPDKKIAQGPGTSEGDDDFTVAQPVPMALLDPTVLASSKDNFDRSGAAGSYQNAKDNACEGSINPMNTDFGSDGLPQNFCIPFGVMSLPGYAAGEMNSLLGSLLTLSSQLFGKNGFFGGGFETKKATNLFDVRNGRAHTLGKPSYAEVVVVVPKLALTDRPLYRVNLYFPVSADQFALNTSLEFSPLTENEDYAEISVRHYSLPEDSIHGQHLYAQYNTMSGEFVADFGSAPIDEDIPAKTSLRWFAKDDYFLIQGGYVWKNELTERVSQKFMPPPHYKPISNDVVLFQSITMNDDIAKTVQSTAYVAAASGSLNSIKIDESIWTDANSGYTAELMRYLVSLLRDVGVNSSCSTLKTTISNALTAANKTIPTAISSLPQDNMCSTNSAATDTHVATILTEACKLIGVNMTMNIQIDGVVTPTTVKLCRKVAEAYLPSNHQFIEVVTDAGSGKRYRAVKLAHDYGLDSVLVQDLLNKAIPDNDADYTRLLELLTAQSFSIDLKAKFTDLTWPAVESRETDYFKNARGKL
jgi:hypothetical protein